MSAPHTRADAKAQARALRADLARSGIAISHGAALDRVAKQHGFRDWNTLSATLGDGWPPGSRITGRYLGHPIAATVLRSEQVRPGWTRLTIDLDEAVDVVRFESFSALRKRITATVGPQGTTVEATSDGTPHLALNP